jgi:hypothetical protein
MYNDEQRDHMKHLSSVPSEKRCWCGWYLLNDCPHCPLDFTHADQVKLKCEICGNAPYRPGDKLVHIVNCPRSE